MAPSPFKLSRFSAWWRKLGRELVEQDLQGAGLSGLAALLRRIDRLASPNARGPLDALEVRVLTALTHQLGPETDAPPADQVLATLESYVLTLPRHKGAALRDLLVVFDHWPRLTLGSKDRFTSLSSSAQRELLESLAASPSPRDQTLYRALRTPVLLAIWSQPATWPAIGYEGPLLDRVPEADGGRASSAPIDRVPQDAP